MKISTRHPGTRLVVDRVGVLLAAQAGYRWADVEGREHRAEIFGASHDYALVQERNNRVTLMPFERILDLHTQEVSA